MTFAKFDSSSINSDAPAIRVLIKSPSVTLSPTKAYEPPMRLTSPKMDTFPRSNFIVGGFFAVIGLHRLQFEEG